MRLRHFYFVGARALTKHGNVPVRSSEQDRATRGKSTLAALHMLRRCVGFSWAKPHSNDEWWMTNDEWWIFTRHSEGVTLHAGSPAHSALFEYFACFPALRARAHIFWFLKSHIQNNYSLFAIEKGLFWKGILEALIFNKGETRKEYGTILR